MSDTISLTWFRSDDAKQFVKQKNVYYAIWDKMHSGVSLESEAALYLLDCDPQPLLPEHAEWTGLVPCVLGCRPNFLTQDRLPGPTSPVPSGQSCHSPGLTGLAGGTHWSQSATGYPAEGCDAGEGCPFYWLQPHPLLLPSSWLPPILLDLTPINLNFGPLPKFLKNLIWL